MVIGFALNYYICWKYLVFLIFVVLGDYENFLTTKISRFTVV